MNLKSLVTAVVMVFVLSGCAGLFKPPVQVTRTGEVPVMKVVKGTSLGQEKGNIRISMVPAEYTANLVTRVEKTTPTRGIQTFYSKAGNYQRYVDSWAETEVVKYIITPENLSFLITINNNLDRVFRGAGAVITYTINGKTQTIAQAQYENFLSAIVVPRGQTQLAIEGPPVTSIPDKATIGIFIYDVATKVDAAGNILKKSNYEWYFKYSTKAVVSEPFDEPRTQYMQRVVQ